tara:strand:- start:2556 stop:6617 length:4062 start_codon:yes stop_codon:yes gene_type:complete
MTSSLKNNRRNTMENGLVVDLSSALSQQEEATQGPNPVAQEDFYDYATPQQYTIGDTSWRFLDGDTIKDSETGESVRLRGINTRETSKFLEDSSFKQGELGGDAATAYIWDLAQKHGFTTVIKSGEKGHHGRAMGDLVDKDGNSFVDTLLRTGVASPWHFSDDSDVSLSSWGIAAEAGKPNEPMDSYENARQAIYEAETDQYGGLPIQKLIAFDAAEYQANPDLYMGMKQINKGANYEGRSRTPFGTGYDTGFATLYKSLNRLGEALANRVGAEETEASFAADASVNQDYINALPTVKMDVTEIDWTSFDEIATGMSGMLGTSLPFMGATMLGMVAAPATSGTSLALPVSMYTGMVLDTMEGKVEDKNLGIAVVAGAAMTFLDRLGIRGLVSPSMMITKEGRDQAIKAIARSKSISEGEASKLLLNFSKKEMLTYIDDAKAFGANQILKGNLFREGVKSLTKSTLGEGATEALQELTEYTAAVIGSEKEWDYDEIENRMTNAIVAGGLMGAGFATPGVAIQVGDWKSIVDFEGVDDGRFDNVNTKYRKEEESEFGYVRSVEEVSEKVRAEYDKNYTDNKGVKGDDHINDLADKHKPPGTTIEHIKAFIHNPLVAVRASVRDTFAEAMGKSRTVAQIQDILGSVRNKVHGGAGYIQQQQLMMAEYRKYIGETETVEASFDVPKGMSSKGRTDYVSTIMYKFYREVVEPATKTKSSWDWSKASPDVLARKDAIIKLDIGIRKNAEALRNGNNKAKKYTDEKPIEFLPDWGYRHKSFRKEYIASHKDLFINTLTSSYGMSHAEATELTNAIVNENQVSTLGDAFDMTRGGVSPSSQKRRTMHISDRPEFDKFLEQNIFKNMDDASRESARFQVHRKFVGKDSIYINKMLANVRKDLYKTMNPEDANRLLYKIAYKLRNMLNAESGNYNRIENESIKQGQKYLTLVATLQGLSNAAFSSMPEMAMLPLGVSRDVLVKNAATQGYLFGEAVGSWIRNNAVMLRIAQPREDPTTYLDRKIAEVRSKGEADPRYIFYTNMKQLLRETGFKAQETGAATTTGVQETNEMTKGLTDAYFKANFLHDQQDMHRMVRLSLFNDFLIEKLDLIESKKGEEDTVGVSEAKYMLRELGISLHTIAPIANMLKEGKELSANDASKYKREFLNGAANFVNQAVPLPNAFNRPLFYSDPRFALLTQFNGFTSTFTANQLPMLWDQLKGKGSKGLTYGTFATMGSMLALAFISQGIKDELKYGETSPYLTDNQKIQRAIYSSGLLGTTERVIGSNFLFPLYGNSSYGPGEFVWDNIAGEAAATGTVGRVYGMLDSAIQSDGDKFMKNFYGSLPFLAPYKHRLMQYQWGKEE